MRYRVTVRVMPRLHIQFCIRIWAGRHSQKLYQQRISAHLQHRHQLDQATCVLARSNKQYHRRIGKYRSGAPNSEQTLLCCRNHPNFDCSSRQQTTLPQDRSPWVSVVFYNEQFITAWVSDYSIQAIFCRHRFTDHTVSSSFIGISRSSRHKRSASGAQRAHYRKKRKFELGRQSANTKLGAKRIHTVRVRGGNLKYRALRLDSGNFAWGSEHVTRKTRVISVVRITFLHPFGRYQRLWLFGKGVQCF
jgi:ribosomal protein eS8